MKKLTEQDYTVRLQCMACCIADKAYNVAYDLKLGICCEEDILELKVLVATLDALKCYDMDDTLTIEEQNEIECLTYQEVLNMIALFVDRCDLCFQPAGTEYILCDE